MKLTTHKDIDINVSDYDGAFTATVQGTRYETKSLDELRRLIDKALKKSKIKVEVPVSIPGSTGGVRHLTLTGVNARTGNVTFRDDLTGEAGQLKQWTRVYRRLSDEEVARYGELAEAKKAAARALDDFLPKGQDAADLVKAALSAKVDTPDEGKAALEDLEAVRSGADRP